MSDEVVTCWLWQPGLQTVNGAHGVMHRAKSHSYKLGFFVSLKSRQSILTADESCAEPKEYSEHYRAL